MRIAVFSDIHGNQYAFTQFLQQIVTMNIDRCYFLGDVFGYYYGQNQCLAQLRIMKNLTCIWGNHDQLFWNVKMKKFNPYGLAIRYGSTYLRYWQITQANCAFMEKWHHGWQENVDGYRMGFFHGTVEKILDGRLYPDTRIVSPKLYGAYDFVFLGHTHHKMYRRINSTYVFNPGSIGQPRDGRGCSYILFDTVRRTVGWNIIKYDMAPLMKEISINDADKPFLGEVLTRRPVGGEITWQDIMYL